MTLLEKINNLTWYDLINKLKDILKGLAGQGGGDPRPYKVYTALLSQLGTNAPVATVLENTLGDIVWSYEGVGVYRGALINLFENPNKVYHNISHTYDIKNKYSIYYDAEPDYIAVMTGFSDSLSNNKLDFTPIEIRVYN